MLCRGCGTPLAWSRLWLRFWRSLAAGLLTGLESLVTTIRGAPGASDFYLHGFEELTTASKQFIVRVALSSHVSDSCLHSFMGGSRVVRHLPALKEAALEEIGWLADLGDGTWSSLAGVSGEAASVLKPDTVAAGSIACAFVHSRYVTKAGQLPWSLACGDPAANLEALSEQPQLQEATAAKIWTLLRLGYNRQQLLAGLRLLLDAPWGTVAVDQQHASAEVIKRFHHEVGMETLLPKSLVHSMRKLLPNASPAENSIAELRGDPQAQVQTAFSGGAQADLYEGPCAGCGAVGQDRPEACATRGPENHHEEAFRLLPTDASRHGPPICC